MPSMSAPESMFCRSAPWRLIAPRLTSWATMHSELRGDVLEIGGGSGAMAERLARAHPGIRLTMTDVDQTMVDSARARLASHPDIAVRRADCTRLPFDDASYDVVASFLMLHHVIDWQAAILESARVLRRGGVLIGYDLTDGRIASLIHRIDGSPHRLMPRGGFESAAADAGLITEQVRYSLRHHVVRFVVRKPS